MTMSGGAEPEAPTAVRSSRPVESTRTGRVAEFVRGTTWSLADQALLSAVNFLTIVITARELAPTQFGAFVLAYTGLLIANGVQTGLVTQPHNVLGQRREGEAYRRYTASTAVAQLILAGGVTGVAIAVGVVALLTDWSAATLVLAAAPAAFTWQLQEFVRRVLYTESRIRAAFVVDLLSYGGQVAVLVALATADALTGQAGLLVVAATSAVGAAYGGWRIRSSLNGRFDPGSLRAHWSIGKWLGAGIGASWVAAQLYVYLTAVALGAAGAGALRAAQTVLGPLNAFLVFLATVLPIRLAVAWRRGGEAGLAAEARFSYFVTLPVVFAYCIAVAVFSEPILRLLYGASYGRYGEVVALFSVYYAVLHVAFVLTSALVARGATRGVVAGHVYAAALGLVLGWLLIGVYGVEGAVLGMSAGALLSTVVFWRRYQTASVVPDREPPDDVATAPPL
jgi:O-antigen/teichoic acid export membrane protein